MSAKAIRAETERDAPGQRPPQRQARATTELSPQTKMGNALQRALIASPTQLNPADLLSLQRGIGNRAVQRLLNVSGADQRNKTGLPDTLKAGIENLSGVSMDDVKVHYNSSRPAEAQALAYTQGTDIYVGPGQEKHLPHEAWHVVQQKQGRVQPTLRAKGVSINSDIALEREADVMSAKVFQTGSPIGTSVEKEHLDSLPALGKSILQKEIKGSDDEHKSLASKPDVIQGYFEGPPQSVIELVYDFVKSMKPEKLAAFNYIYGSPIHHANLYDFIADQLHTHINQIYEWDDLRNAQQQSPLDYGFSLASQAQSRQQSRSSPSPSQPPEKQSSPSSSQTSERGIELESDPRTQLGMELAKLPMTELLKKAFRESGVPKKILKDLKLFNMLLDIGATELQQMPLDSKVTKLHEYYKNWLAYTSCHNTAVKLISRMTATPGGLGSYVGLDKDQAKIRTDGDWLGAVSKGLETAISDDLHRNNRSIYEVHCGGHGFAILVRNGEAEIIQSFANAVALVERMERGPLILKDGHIQKIITDLASSKTSDRDRAANVIADCNAEVFGLDPYPSFQYRWRQQKLLSDVELLDYFETELLKAYNAIKALYRNW